MLVAILGTGKMGGAMARRLESQGHRRRRLNRTRERAESLGRSRPPSGGMLRRRGRHLILTDADAVRAAYLGQGGLRTRREPVFIR